MINFLIYMTIQTIIVAIVLGVFVKKNKFKEKTYDCIKTLIFKYPFLNNVYLIDKKGSFSMAKYNKLNNKIYI